MSSLPASSRSLRARHVSVLAAMPLVTLALAGACSSDSTSDSPPAQDDASAGPDSTIHEAGGADTGVRSNDGAAVVVDGSDGAAAVDAADAHPHDGSSIVPPSNPADVPMHHNDLSRSGQMLVENTLTLANVNQASFGKLRILPADGSVTAQPLFISDLKIGSETHDVVFVATQHDTVYAYDAATGNEIWHVSMLAAGETSTSIGCPDLSPEAGVTATPVIDRTRGTNGIMYVVSSNTVGINANHKLHALDLATGAELLGGPTVISGSYPGNGDNSVNGTITFDPNLHTERAALTLVNGSVFLGWTAHCMNGPYTGWLMIYSADTLQQTNILNITPNGSKGSIWMAGSGMASDGTSVYVIDGNGTFTPTLDSNGFPNDGNLGNTFMKLSGTGKLAVTDYFAPYDNVNLEETDGDFGSGGPLLLPDQTTANGTVKHLAVGAGKDNKIYVVDRDNMSKFDSSANMNWQTITGALNGGIWGSAAYFNGTVYYGGINDNVRAFPITDAKLATSAASMTPTTFVYPGATPAISANGTQNGIVWVAENGTTGALHAYDASDLSKELYNSNQAGNRDQWGAGNKFITPMIARGKVYVGTQTGVAVFGLLP